MTDGMGAGKLLSSDPASRYQPPETYRRGQKQTAPTASDATSTPSGQKSCEHPGCGELFVAKRKDSRFCAEHSKPKWHDWRRKSAQGDQKSRSPAKGGERSNTPGPAAVVQPSGRKRPAKEARPDRTQRSTERAAGGRVAHPPAAPHPSPHSDAAASVAATVTAGPGCSAPRVSSASDRPLQSGTGGSSPPPASATISLEIPLNAITLVAVLRAAADRLEELERGGGPDA